MAKWNGTKKELLEHAIQQLGLDASSEKVFKWIKAHYHTEVHNTQFYTVRRNMLNIAAEVANVARLALEEENAMKVSPKLEQRPTITVLERIPKVEQRPTITVLERIPNKVEPKPPQDNGIVALVKTAQALVEKLGKQEAKNLIDTL